MAIDYSSVRREIDEALGSIGRIRIIAELAKVQDRRLTVYAISALTGLKRTDVKSNLIHLVSIGWVSEYRSLPIKYQINLNNSNAVRWTEFLRSTGYL